MSNQLEEAAQAALEMLEADPSGYTRQDKQEWLRDVKNDLRAALAEKTEDRDRVAALEESLSEHMDEIRRLRADIKDMIERPVVEVSMKFPSIENAEPYLWYADDTGDTWTPDAVADGYAPTDLRPLYTAPPRREWQGLTDKEISDAIRPLCTTPETHKRLLILSMDEYRAIEAALKEKNG